MDRKFQLIIISLLLLSLVAGGWGWIRSINLEREIAGYSELQRLLQEMNQEQSGSEDFYFLESQDEEISNENRERVGVTIAQVFSGELAETISYDGNIQPSQTLTVFPKVMGEAKEIYVEEGDYVEKGDLLLRLDTREIDKNIEQAEATVEAARMQVELAEEGVRFEEEQQIKENIRQAETSLEQLEKTYNRMKRLYEEGIISTQEYEQVATEKEVASSQLASARLSLAMAQTGAREKELEAARAELRSAEIQLELARMRKDDAEVFAPQPGTVTQRNVEVGEMVTEAQPPFVLIRMDPIRISFYASERNLPKIERGQKAEVKLRAYPGETFYGEVTRVAPAADPDTRLFPVEIEIPNPDHSIRPGMYAEIDVIVEKGEQGVWVPKEAIREENDTIIVYTATGGTAELREIVTGPERNGEIFIKSGLPPQENVIVYANDELFPGASIQIEEER